MPRPLVYGNGRMLIAFDDRHQARDLFWPNVGYPNHLLGHAMRVGIWCDGEFSWCDSEDWTLDQRFRDRSPVGESVWRSWKLGLEIIVTEVLDPELPVFVRSFEVTDLRGSNRLVKLFFTQNFILGQSDVGNTAFYNPFCDTVIHYRGPHVVLCTARADSGRLDGYATGIKGFAGLEGTWRDAEDGALSMNPIAQGSVDSTIFVSLKLIPQGSSTAHFVMALSDRIDEAVNLYESVSSDLSRIVQRAEDETTKWLERASVTGIDQLPEPVQSLFFRSLLLIRTQIDHDGAILAANDADILATNRATYSYCWPRDGALVSIVLARLGFPEYAEKFVEFCSRVKLHNQPFLLQKYRSDGSFGASWHPWVIDGIPAVPFQEDETALTLSAIAHCSKGSQLKLWSTFGKDAADFLLSHRSMNGLPLASWDLWEERHGVHFYTACAVIAGLRAADNICCELKINAPEYKKGAENMLQQLRKITKTGSRRMFDEASESTADSAIIGGLLLIGEPTDSALKLLATKLEVKSEIGGYARYDGDYYFRKTDDYPGNPWVISTLWFARAYLQQGQEDECLACLEKVCNWATDSGVLAEQYHPETGSPLSVSPLTWSHAEFVETVIDYLDAKANEKQQK